MFRIEGKDADALGLEVAAKAVSSTGTPSTAEEIEKEAWNQLRTCYDPEIPVNIVDLGLVYDCHVDAARRARSLQDGREDDFDGARLRHGAGSAQDVQNKLLSIEAVDEATVRAGLGPAMEPRDDERSGEVAARTDVMATDETRITCPVPCFIRFNR